MAATSTQAPWWSSSFSRIDNFGSLDPQGRYWKPDSNIQLPGLYPITALLSGIVTSVQNTSFGQNVVTIRLDSPLNNLATHTFYEHMSSTTVQVGQHVSAGTLIGYNNPQGQVPLGFGLYSGDTYGSGSAWQTLQNDLCPGCANLLNPTKLLNAAKSGTLPQSGGNSFLSSFLNTGSSNPAGNSAGCATGDIGCYVQQGIQNTLGTMFGDLFGSNFFEQSIIVVIGIAVVIIGLIALIRSSSKES